MGLRHSRRTAALRRRYGVLLNLAIRSKNYEAAFEAAHGLKGSSGTLGLTPLYEAVCAVVENLRYEPGETLEEDYETMRLTYGHFTEIMKAEY